MPRRSRRAVPRSFRRTKAFLAANLLLWAGLAVWFAFQPPERQEDVARLVGNAFDRRKQVTAFDVVWDLWQLRNTSGYVAAADDSGAAVAYAGLPASPQRLRVLRNIGYIVGYSEDWGAPAWVAYRVKDREPREPPPRPGEFAIDDRTRARIAPEDYTNSGFDRGHMAPSFVMGLEYGVAAQQESFLMSNIVPQRHALNGGMWSRLERRIAINYPARFGEIWVLTGPVFPEHPRRLRGRVAVPEAFFLLVIDEVGGRVRAEAFLVAQDAPEDADPDSCLTTVDEIERRTGLDLMQDLPDDAEAALESRQEARMW